MGEHFRRAATSTPCSANQPSDYPPRHLGICGPTQPKVPAHNWDHLQAMWFQGWLWEGRREAKRICPIAFTIGPGSCTQLMVPRHSPLQQVAWMLSRTMQKVDCQCMTCTKFFFFFVTTHFSFMCITQKQPYNRLLAIAAHGIFH